jgi:hypothetical protein
LVLHEARARADVRANKEADAATEFEIQPTGLKTLSADDFYL